MTTIVLVSLATALFVIFCVGAGGCAWMWRRHFTRRRVHARLSSGSFGRAGCCGSGRTRRVSGPGESRLEALQRRFVSGQITLDEYERDIDRLQQLALPR